MGVISNRGPAATERGRIHARRWLGQQGKGERMDKRFSQRKSGQILGAAVASVGLIGWASQQADASMLIDVRATGVSAGGTLGGPKSVTAGNGVTVTLDVFARITGANST